MRRSVNERGDLEVTFPTSQADQLAGMVGPIVCLDGVIAFFKEDGRGAAYYVGLADTPPIDVEMRKLRGKYGLNGRSSFVVTPANSKDDLILKIIKALTNSKH